MWIFGQKRQPSKCDHVGGWCKGPEWIICPESTEQWGVETFERPPVVKKDQCGKTVLGIGDEKPRKSVVFRKL